MPYYPTTVAGPRAILANSGSVTWLLGGQSLNTDANGIQALFYEPVVAGGSLPASPAYSTGFNIRTYTVQSYFNAGGAATIQFQASMTNRDADFVGVTPVNGLYQTNAPFFRVFLSGITAGGIAVAITF